ncbi:MAG: hypothetical protein M3Q57_00730 [Pseudomonadota bacterium]|nr:hypothetical protein [Pseudomonadota bacterium]
MAIDWRPILFALAASLAAPGQAQTPAQASPASVPQAWTDSGPDAASIRLTEPDCRSTAAANPDEILVCAERSDPYRIDPAILSAGRAVDASPERRPAYQSVGVDKCSPVGIAGCPGRDVIPVTRIALTIARAALMAAKGDDWREVFRTREDEYRLMREAKAKAARDKVRVSLGPRPR